MAWSYRIVVPRCPIGKTLQLSCINTGDESGGLQCSGIARGPGHHRVTVLASQRISYLEFEDDMTLSFMPR
jgi:hypothetical protein